MPQQGLPPPPPPPPRDQPGRSPGRTGWPRWSIWVLIGLLLVALLLPSLFSTSSGTSISYSEFLTDVRSNKVESVDWHNNNGKVDGVLKDGSKFTTNGPVVPSDDDRALLTDHGVQAKFKTPQSSLLASLLPLLLPIALLIGFFVWMNRRAQGQMS